MTSAEFIPKPEKAFMQPADIYDQLRTIAFVSKAFRTGKTNNQGFTTEHTVAIDQPENQPQPKGWQDQYKTKTYRFEGMRVEAPNGTEVLDFTYGQSKSHHNIHLPANIAEYAYGAKKNPVLAAGPSTMIESVDVAIGSDDYEVYIKESVQYIDASGHQVVSLNSEPYPDTYKRSIFPRKPVKPSGSPGEVGPLDVETVTGRLGIPLSFRTDATYHHETEEEPLKLEKMKKFIKDFGYQERDLIVATKILGRVTRNFRDQLGMNI